MSEFDDIRPYHDSEVRSTLDRIVADPELTRVITQFKFPQASQIFGWLLRPLVKRKLQQELTGINDVKGFQDVIEKYMSKMIESTMSGFSVSGLEQLDAAKPYLFISNHRDIAMDPAFV